MKKIKILILIIISSLGLSLKAQDLRECHPGYKYLPSLIFTAEYFAGTPLKLIINCGFVEEERIFPVRFNFDGDLNLENNLENYIEWKIGYGITGQAGSKNCKISQNNRTSPNDQRPAVLFHKVNGITLDGITYNVYEYWYYYANNDWEFPKAFGKGNANHEHDWQPVFVYAEVVGNDDVPRYIAGGIHYCIWWISWNDAFILDNHPVINIEEGSHGALPVFTKRSYTSACDDAQCRILGLEAFCGFKNAVGDRTKGLPKHGVMIKYDGTITVSNGCQASTTCPNNKCEWLLLMDDSYARPSKACMGDPCYGDGDLDRCDPLAWDRVEWDTPPKPNDTNYIPFKKK